VKGWRDPLPGPSSGTVTFLFTDIEGSTRALQTFGDAGYAGLLAEYRRILRDRCSERGGRELEAPGDGFLFTFPRAKDSLLAVVAAQRAIARHPWPQDAAVRVRMGLHTGEPLSAESGYVGIDVHRAARICAAAHGGQILVSRTTHDLVADDLPSGIRLRDLGEHRLRELNRPQRLFQVIVSDLPSEFPPPKSQSALADDLLYSSILPPRPTPLVGRERELPAIQALLSSDARLVTLTGPPGIGKSRLALEVAACTADEGRQGVVMVDLVPVSDPARVGEAIAQTLGIHEIPEQSALARVTEALRDRSFLLVLDNFEHVLDAASQVGGLLSTCTQLRVLATSRVPLHVAWENEFPVPPLALPELDAVPALEALAECPSVALFLARARATAPDFRLTGTNARTLTEICRQLDGLPLAIELAAPRVKLLPLTTVLERLQHRLDFLHRVGRDLPARHQTLRAAIGWSYALLQPYEQALLRRLSVFVGGFTLEAAETVCWSADQPCEALDAINILVDASLMAREVALEEPRYRMLETIKEFASEQLAATGELPRMKRHHAAYMLALAEHAEPRLHGPDAAPWIQRLNREQENFRAALTWTLQEGEGQAALRLALALWWGWYVGGSLREGRTWIESALAAVPDPPANLRAKALYAAGVIAWRQGEFQTAAGMGEQSLHISRDITDRWGMANALFLLEMVARTQGDYAKAATLMEESLSLFRAVNDTWGVATALLGLGAIMRLRGEHRPAAHNCEESLRLFRGLQDFSGVAASLYSLGLVALEQGDLARASDLAMEALTLARTQDDRSREAFACQLQGLVARARGEYIQAAAGFEASRALFDRIGDAWGVAYSLGSLGTVARLQSDHLRANALFRQSLSLRSQHGDRWGIADCLEGLGVTAAVQGATERGARLLGAAEALRDSLGTPLGLADKPDHDRAVGVTRAALGKRRFEAAWSQGRAFPVDLLLQEILRETEEPAAATPAKGLRRPGPLTTREMEVAQLIARGMTNQEVASALYITSGTVATHVQHILAKLGYDSRAQIAAWASTQSTAAPPEESAPR